jgi:hypothetical protein
MPVALGERLLCHGRENGGDRGGRENGGGATTNTYWFSARPLIPHPSRPRKPTAPVVLPRPHRLATGGSFQHSGNFPVQNQFKRNGGARGRNHHPRLPRNRRPQGSDERKDGGAPTGRSGGGAAPPPDDGGGEPTAAAKERFALENMTGIDELPSRPEVRRAGLDSLAWPTRKQKADKLEESTYYVPKHEGRGTMRDNPLIRQGVLEEALRFRGTDPMPRPVAEPSYPAQAVRERVQMLLQNTYATNGELKMNPNVCTSVTMSRPMMTTLYTPKPWQDVFVPASVQAGGAAHTRAGPMYSLS